MTSHGNIAIIYSASMAEHKSPPHQVKRILTDISYFHLLFLTWPRRLLAGCYIINIIYKIPDLYITAEYNSSYMKEDMRSLSLTKGSTGTSTDMGICIMKGGQTLLLASAARSVRLGHDHSQSYATTVFNPALFSCVVLPQSAQNLISCFSVVNEKIWAASIKKKRS